MRFSQSISAEGRAKTDLKDRKILSCLSEDARMPHSRIARRVGLSKDAVKYRIRNMEKEGVIQGYTAVIDTHKLGYGTYHVFLQLNRMNNQVRSELVKRFKSYPFTRVVIEFSGKYDFEIGLSAGSIEELDSFVTEITDDVSAYLQDQQVLVISKSYERRIFPKSFMESRTEANAAKPSEQLKIDKTDIRILKALAENSRRPLYEIGGLAGLSDDAAHYRIRRLKKMGIITGFVPVINYSALGYSVYAVLLNIHNLSRGKEVALGRFLRTNADILWAVKAIGRFNLLAYVCAKGPDDLHRTLVSLREIFSSDIRDYETLIAYEEYKYTYFPEIFWKEGKHE